MQKFKMIAVYYEAPERPVWHTQNIHATLKLKWLFDDELRLLGNVSNQALHRCDINFLLNSHLNFLCDCLDLKEQNKTYMSNKIWKKNNLNNSLISVKMLWPN